MKTWTRLLFSATALTTAALAAPALAADLDQTVAFSIAPGSLDEALIAYAKQADLQVISASSAVRGKRTTGVEGAATPRQALAMLLRDSGLDFVATSPSTVTVTQGEQAGGGSADGTVEALIVTAQKREENIQDVPIAISAFSQKTLDEQKIEGGFDLLKAIPNVTFSKNNFTSYNFSIRGIGTKAVSVTTDPGVAVEFNDTPLIRNRLFEQEYFDVQRVEVLRGPQGTLHGRNATGGVINVISAKPNLTEFSGWVKGEVGNFHTKRLSAMTNIPLVEDKLALRLAGALTSREGYDYNTGTEHAVNGRDLWSARLSIGFQPTDTIHADLVWERFAEDDDRSRTGKQLCHRDPGPTMLGSTPLPGVMEQGHLSQGCKPGSLYDPMAFGTPNGLSIPFIQVATDSNFINIGTRNGAWITPIQEGVDPYGGMMQSTDLRRIDSVFDPIYRANTDVIELNASWDLTPALTVTSLTAYLHDQLYSSQDYNRFNTVPIFVNGSGLGPNTSGIDFSEMLAGGVYCDPQLGCAKSIAGLDISQARSEQFSQEIRLQSDFDGPLNFSIGANYTRYRTVEDYYVFYNLITLVAQAGGGIPVFNSSPDITMCARKDGVLVNGKPIGFSFNSSPDSIVPIDSPEGVGCIYIDPNPVDKINGEGHNYFRSKNPYKMQSKAAFGELYWKVNDEVKLTAGLRYTDDNKVFTPVPSQTLLSSAWFLAGTVDRGYPVLPDIDQQWGEWTGRLGVDWKTNFAFTNESMLYAFYSRGYKGGGANPPGIGYETRTDFFGHAIVQPLSYPKLFEPEFVNAFEVGAKNTLLEGALTLNLGAFYYDYKDYQVSQIKERTAVNENFDATVWGLELESLFAPSKNLRINFNLGYQDTRIADGEQSIDLMNRTQGDPNYAVVKPYVLLSSNCVVPVQAAEDFYNTGGANFAVMNELCGGVLALPVDPLHGPNGGAGFYADLSGNELPNAPHWTTSVGAQYGVEMFAGWRATVRADAYWQSQSWARVYNAVNDKLHGWYNANLSLWIENDDGLKIELYAKNLLNDTPITDAFLNSDDSALTTNVFTLDPRLIGLSIRKEF